MKKFPTALTVPRISFRLWLKIAPPLEAMRAGAGKIMGRRGLGAAGAAIIRRRGDRLPKSKKLVSMPFCSRKALTLTSCDLMRVAQHRRLLGDGGAAEEDDARQHAREHQADDRQPQRMRQPDDAPEQVAHGVEGDAEQHAGKNQKQGRGEMPGEQQQGGEQHDADAADRYRPRQIVAGLKAIVSRTCHVDSFSQTLLAPPLFRQNAAGIKR